MWHLNCESESFLPLTWASNVAALPSSATTLCSGCVNVGACVDMMVGTLQGNREKVFNKIHQTKQEALFSVRLDFSSFTLGHTDAARLITPEIDDPKHLSRLRWPALTHSSRAQRQGSLFLRIQWLNQNRPKTTNSRTNRPELFWFSETSGFSKTSASYFYFIPFYFPLGGLVPGLLCSVVCTLWNVSSRRWNI